MILLRLFAEFFRTGLFAVGGGLATMPFLSDIGARTGWFTRAELADMIAVSESTPGPMGVNMATYVGYKTAGVVGSVVATSGLVLPSLSVILIVALVLDRFRQDPRVDAVFKGLRPASTGLIAAAGWSVACIALFVPFVDFSGTKMLISVAINWKCIALAAVVFALTRWKLTNGLHPIVWIALSAVAGVVFSL